MRNPAVQGAILVGVVAAVLLFTHLNYPLQEPDEGRYAEIPLLMVRSGDYLAPHLQGRPYLDKPPLTYWLVAISYHVFGVHEWSARLPASLTTWLTILATYFWACRTLGPRPALLSALVLTTSFGFVRFGRMILPDAPLAACITLSLWLGQAAIAGPTRRFSWWLGSAVCCGLGVLTKGPVALVLVLPCLAVAQWQSRGVASFVAHALAWCIYLGVVALVAAPWFLWAHGHLPGFTEEFFWRHNVLRYAAAFHHTKPWWYYGPVLLTELLPWSPLLIVLPVCWRLGHRSPAPVRFCWFAAAWCFIFFSAAGCKLPAYLLPALPLLAIVLGHTLDQFVLLGLADGLGEDAVKRIQRLSRWIAATTTVGLLLAIGVWACLQRHWPVWEAIVAPIGAMALLGAVFWRIVRRLKDWPAWSSCGGIGSALLAFWVWQAIPAHAHEASTGHPAHRFVRLAEREGLPIAAYRGSWDAAGFYEGGPELLVVGEPGGESVGDFLYHHPRAWIIARNYNGRGDELLRSLPTNAAIERAVKCGVVIGWLIGPQPASLSNAHSMQPN